MKTKKTFIQLTFILAIFVLSSCSDELENVFPEPDLSEELSFTAGNEAEDIETD